MCFELGCALLSMVSVNMLVVCTSILGRLRRCIANGREGSAGVDTIRVYSRRSQLVVPEFATFLPLYAEWHLLFASVAVHAGHTRTVLGINPIAHDIICFENPTRFFESLRTRN